MSMEPWVTLTYTFMHQSHPDSILHALLARPTLWIKYQQGGLAKSKRLLQNSLHFQPKTHGQARFKIVLWVAKKKKSVVVEEKITFPLGCFPMRSSLDSTQEGCRVNGGGSAPQENTAFLTPNGHYGSGRMCKDDFVFSSISMYNMWCLLWHIIY